VDTSCIVSFIGDDRPGLVDSLSRAIRDAGGNWQDSRLARMGGKFAGLIRVRLPAEHMDALRKALAATGLDCTVTDTHDGEAPQGALLTLTVVGPDRPGIVREIASELGARSINVQRMESHVEPAPMSSETLFHASIQVRLPSDLDRASLAARLDEIAAYMTIEIDLLEH